MRSRSSDPRAERLLARLRSLHLASNDYAVYGSGPLIVRGIVPADGDLDVLCRRGAWEAVVAIGNVVHLAEHDATLVELDGGLLTFGTTWRYGGIDVDAVIETAEAIDGLPFARLEYVRRYKAAMGRPKDVAHLAALDVYELRELDKATGAPGTGDNG